ncbi:MAG: hypothetical protein LBU90_03570 [Bacteroidales bacterium]|jgi:hypothetical protein|nr:hypothetical protein [Bacteroidales bacterium]
MKKPPVNLRNVVRMLSTLAVFTVFVSCEKNQAPQSAPPQTHSDGAIVLGKKINDPYSISNMRAAYANIAGAGLKSELAPNRIYMRFLPKNEEEWDLLKSDKTLLLYDFPLDYEIAVHGNYYHDPSLPKDAITWQYVVVPVDYKIPNIQHEILYEVFIPEYEDQSVLKSSETDFYDKLEEEAFRLTGNLPEGAQLKASKWIPQGRITVWDDLLNMEIPLEGAEVHGRWSVHTEKTLTNADGYYTLPEFRYEVNYCIKWQRSDFDIRDGNLFQAWFDGPKQKGDWNLPIRSGLTLMYATILRAANRSFYGDNLGIKRPQQANNTKICYLDKHKNLYEGFSFPTVGVSGVFPDVHICGRDKNGYFKTTHELFALTIHELGHQSHWQLVGAGNFIFSDRIIYESWATAIQVALTGDEYKKLGIKYKGTPKQYDSDKTQLWPDESILPKEYSLLFVDLMDDSNQRELYNSTKYPNDRIKGYSLSYIQNNIIVGSKSISDVKAKLKTSKIAGVTDADIDELVRLY